jgi:hypothetical protein
MTVPETRHTRSETRTRDSHSSRTRTAERTITLDDNIDELLNSYKTQGQSLVSITYKSPSMGTPKHVQNSVEKLRDNEAKLAEKMGAHKQTEREILASFGYEQIPVLMRPIEAVRRRFMGSEDDTLEKIAQIGSFYADTLEDLQGNLITVLKDYERATERVESYIVHLEDTMVSLSQQKEGVEERIAAIEEVKEQYVASAPQNGTYAEKVIWRRGLRAIEKDERSLRSLNLRVTQDLNQATEHQKIAVDLGEGLEVSYTINAMSVSTSEMLTDHLRVNLVAYATSSRASNHAINIHHYLEKTAEFSSLLSQATSERMTTVGRLFERFSLPSGAGARDIANGGLLDGLKGYMTQMQEAHDAVNEHYSKEMIP